MILLTLKTERLTVKATKLPFLPVKLLGRTLICPGLTFLIKLFARGWIDLVCCYAESVLVRGSARTQPNPEIIQTLIFNLSSPPFIPGQSIVQRKLQANFLDQIRCAGLPDLAEIG